MINCNEYLILEQTKNLPLVIKSKLAYASFHFFLRPFQFIPKFFWLLIYLSLASHILSVWITNCPLCLFIFIYWLNMVSIYGKSQISKPYWCILLNLCAQMPILINLEQRVLSLWRKRAEELIARRRQDVLDQANENAPCKYFS